MKPLLSIKCVPIEIDISSTRPMVTKSGYKQATATATRIRGGFKHHYTPGKLTINNSAARASIGQKSSVQISREFAQKSHAKAAESAIQTVREGRILRENMRAKYPASDFIMSKIMAQKQFGIAFIPASLPEISYQPAQLDFEYVKDEYKYDWNLHTRTNLEFIPGEIYSEVITYPDVIIEYIGGPILAPPSANPDYSPVDISI